MFTGSSSSGFLSTITGGLSQYFKTQADGIAAGASLEALKGQAIVQSIQAKTEAGNLANKFKLGAVKMLMDSDASQAEYRLAQAKYIIQSEGKKGQAALYDNQANIKLLEESYIMRNAAILGASALDAMRVGAEAESKLRAEGRVFRGSQVAEIAAGGTDVASGTARDIIRQTDEGIEADSAAIRFTSQKNRWKLLVQQQNMWLTAEARKLDGDGYQAAANALRNSAETSLLAADLMDKTALLAEQSGQAGHNYYLQLADISMKGGDVASADLMAQANMYGNMAENARGASNIAAWGGLLSTIPDLYNNYMPGKTINASIGADRAYPERAWGVTIMSHVDDTWAKTYSSGWDPANAGVVQDWKNDYTFIGGQTFNTSGLNLLSTSGSKKFEIDPLKDIKGW